MEAQTTTVKHLLETVTKIREKYDEIAKITGENFNIFSVLKLESDEVRLHSRLLGELLNPKGSHNQGFLFLKLFVEMLGYEYSDHELAGAEVIVEKNIGNIPDDYSKGGRIDLIVVFPNNVKEIVIENKIWADDQPNQLGRYYMEYPNSYIVYLTPFKNKPSKSSLGEKLDLESRVYCISYQTEIKKWIELCQKEVPQLPLIREVFSHYLILINKLTNQSKNKEMENHMENIIAKDLESFNSAALIQSTLQNIKNSTLSAISSEFDSKKESLCNWDDLRISTGIDYESFGTYYYVSVERENSRIVNLKNPEFNDLYNRIKGDKNNYIRSNHCLVLLLSSFDIKQIINNEGFSLVNVDERKKILNKIYKEYQEFRNSVLITLK